MMETEKAEMDYNKLRTKINNDLHRKDADIIPDKLEEILSKYSFSEEDEIYLVVIEELLYTLLRGQTVRPRLLYEVLNDIFRDYE